MNLKILIGFLVAVLGLGCQSGDSALGTLKKIERNIQKNPTPENFDLYFSESARLMAENIDDKDVVKAILERGRDVAIDHEQYVNATSFLMPLVKNYPEDSERDENLIALARIMNTMNKSHVAATLYSGYKQQYPQSGDAQQLESIMGPEHEDISAFVDTIFNQVFVNPDEFGLNRSNALKFVDVAEAYALVYPEAKNSPFYLYRAGEIARSVRTMPKALSIYDWILESYPGYEKSPTVLFLKGFILENDLEDIENARIVYDHFLTTYPNHELTPSVKFLIENLGKSDEEILEFIEQQRESNQGQDSDS